MKIRLINWKKVNYIVKADVMEYMIDHPKLYPVVDYGEQHKAWELFFSLTYLLVIYTTFIVGLPVFLTLSNTIFWFLPLIGILMTVFFMGADLLNMFTKWVKIPVSIYLLLLFLYFIQSTIIGV